MAVKVERKDAKHSQLQYEVIAYERLAGGPGIPRVHWFGTDPDLDSSAMVMDRLGPNLENLFNCCKREFSLRTVVMLAGQLITRLEYIHAHHILHRDLKPENIVVGTGAHRNQVNIIDFGLADIYRDTTTGKHIPYSHKKNLVGTARYASIHSHLGIELSRRDDMESLGYILVYLAKGSLPWQELLKETNGQKNSLILREKLLTPTTGVCEGLPYEFAAYLDYVRSMKFEQKPDYCYLRQLFDGLAVRAGISCIGSFDWAEKL